MKGNIGGVQTFSFGKDLVFDAFVQFKEYSGFLRCLSALQGVKLCYKERDSKKAWTCNIRVDFDKTKHLAESTIKKRKAERDRIITEERSPLGWLSKYPPDVKIITLDGPLPAHRGLLCRNKTIDAKFYPTDGNPSERITLPALANREAATLFRDAVYGLDIREKLEQTTSHTTLHYVEKLALE